MAERKEKKKYAEPEMGYCPFEHWLGRTSRLGAHGAWARGWALGWALGEPARGARGRGGRHEGAVGGRHGRTAGRRAAAGEQQQARARAERAGQGWLGGRRAT